MKKQETRDDAAADDSAAAQSQPDDENFEDEAGADDADETKRFERSDNLRRRSEWFRKRTGGG